MLNIIFPQKENITNDLEKLNDTILWRKCDDYDDYLDNPEGDYFTLRRRGRHEPEDNVSFFALNPSEQIEDNGFNFLSFIFCYPFRNPFCIDQLQFSKSASVSLKPKKLLILVRSSRNLAEKLLSLKITKHQKNKPHATHYGLYFQKDINNGVYYDLDADVKRALYQCSDL